MQILHPYTHPQPLKWGQKVNYSTILEYGDVAYQRIIDGLGLIRLFF